VIGIDQGRVEYRVLHGPARKKTPLNCCSLKKFLVWAQGEFVGEDYAQLDGAKRYTTALVLNVAGQALFRCSERRAAFYLRKGFAVRVDEGTLRLIDDTTEKKLAELYQEGLSPFFLAVKNDRCVVCGQEQNLTRHHVVPQRQKEKLSLEMRRQLSNILFLCRDCHNRYEDNQLHCDSTDPYVWKQHFVDVMEPQFLPQGWDIVLVVRRPSEDNQVDLSEELPRGESSEELDG
jgi:hypothetical protein